MMPAQKKLELVGGPKDGEIKYNCPLPEFIVYQEQTCSGWTQHRYRRVGTTDKYLYERPHG